MVQVLHTLGARGLSIYIYVCVCVYVQMVATLDERVHG